MRLPVRFYLKRRFWSVFLLSIVFFSVALPVYANWSDTLGSIVGWLIGLFISALGLVLILVIKGLLLIASYQNFIGSPAVFEGWAIVRDLSNMFFVVILLVIAFSTILHLENYSYKKWLPKLILMAVLINFSKTICGLLIDVAQIVMLTFVNAFKDIAGGNFIDMLGIRDIVTMAKNTDDLGFWAIVGAYVLGLIYMIVAVVVIATMMMMLVMRLVMIWIYVVLSPLAYLLAAFPGGAQYSSKWWKDFTQNLIVGPVLAFFIWLSFAALQNGNELDIVRTAKDNSVNEEIAAVGAPTNSKEKMDSPVAITEASTPDALIKFVIGIGMLVGGLKISQEMGGAAGSIAGKGMNKLSKMGAVTTGFVGKGALGISKDLGMGLAKKAKVKEGLGYISSRTGAVGRALAVTGIRGLATKGLVGLNSQEAQIKEKAKKKLSIIDDTRVIARYANESAFGGMGMAMRKKARTKMPDAIESDQEMNDVLASMNLDDLKELSDARWTALGTRRAHLGGRSRNFVNKDSDARGAFNLGMQSVGVPESEFIVGTDRNGEPLHDNNPDRHGSYMNPRNLPLSPDELDTLFSRGRHRFDYYKDPRPIEADTTEKVSPEKQNQERGKGDLAINGFAAGRSTLAVDFDKLNLEDIEKGSAGDKDWRNVRGVNTSDPAEINKIASRLISLIDGEISSLQAKGNLNKGEEKRLSSLNEAKNRLSNPENLSNLALVNSSASRFKMSDVKETIIHEEIHGLGYEDEEEVRTATSTIMATRNYDARKDKASIDAILGKQPLATRPVDQIIAAEKESGPVFDDSPQTVDFDLSPIEQKLANFAKQLESAGSKISNLKISGVSGSASQAPYFIYLLKALKKSLTNKDDSSSRQIAALASSLGVQKAETPLEFRIIANNLPADLKPKNKVDQSQLN